jgi:predicted enzyme related to lactoylglutathione lyase
MVYFAARDLDAAVRFLREKGVTVSDPRKRGDSPRFTEFADSEGNPIGLYETPTGPSGPLTTCGNRGIP